MFFQVLEEALFCIQALCPPLFCISTISSETKTRRKTNRPATQAHCLGSEASCASRMLFVAILRISSCQTWKVWQLHVGFACTYRWHRCGWTSPIGANSIILCMLWFNLYDPETMGLQQPKWRVATRKSTDSVNRRNTASPTLNVLNPVSNGVLHISWCSLSSINTMTHQVR